MYVTQQERRLAGVLRYKGETPKQPGSTWFGVELAARHAGEGTCDGLFQRNRFFNCGNDCAVFVSLSKIRRRHDDDVDDDDGGVGDTPMTKLAVNERVVWLNDNGDCCKATVRWFGYLPDEMGYELIAGVEFDERVGKGTGRFRGRHIFHTRKGHASLIPISGLIRESLVATEESSYDDGATAKTPDIVNAHVEQEPAPGDGDGDGRPLPIGSRVEVLHNPVRRGVIRWIGQLQDDGPRIAGLEMADVDPLCYTAGTFKKKQIFPCPEQRAFFVPLHKCRPDRQTVSFCGPRRGIHGSASSSHMDVVLFAMFACRGPFDALLDAQCVAAADSPASDHAECGLMLTDLARLLRSQHYVDNDAATKLYQALNKICPSVCLDRQDPDPSEFLSFVCRDVLKAAPFMELSTGQSSYVYQLESTGGPTTAEPPTVQNLFAKSLLQHDAKLCSVTAPLIIRMPLGGKDTARRCVFPVPHLDISELLTGSSARRCHGCSNVARIDCRECSRHFCEPCFATLHRGEPMNRHNGRHIVGYDATSGMGPLLELFAVVTMEDQRCMSYVRFPEGSSQSWLVFETAPDSVGAEANPSVPVVRQCPDIAEWFSEERRQSVVNQTSDVPTEISSIVSNASLCFYRFLESKQSIYVSLIP